MTAIEGTTAEPEHHEVLADRFAHGARCASHFLGNPWAFATAVALVLLWAASGPIFQFSAAWQLIINTGTTIGTFLMVFLLQNTQNRDSLAIQLKLDELLRGTQGPRTGLVALENLSDDELKRLEAEFDRLAERSPVSARMAEEVEDEYDERHEPRGAHGAGHGGGTATAKRSR